MPFTELGGSPRESFSESSGSNAERKFLIPWNNRIAFCQGLVSFATAYPHIPQARVVSIDVQPFSDDLIPFGTIVSPELSTNNYLGQPCLVTVKYGPDYTHKTWPTDFPKPKIRGGTELRFQIRGSAKFLLVPTAACKWEDDEEAAVPEDVNSALLIPLRSIQLQWDFVDDPPINRLDGLQGQVNSDVFLGAPAEALLFESYEISETFRSAPLNPHTNRCTINLTQRRILTGEIVEEEPEFVGWNHDYREEPSGWAKLLLSDDKPRYKTTAFSGMFL